MKSFARSHTIIIAGFATIFGATSSWSDSRPRDQSAFAINSHVMGLANIALGDGLDACKNADVVPLSDGLQGCQFGSDADRITITFDVSRSYVIRVERKLLVNYRRMDWQKYVQSARLYGEPQAYNLNHWIVGYGDNFEVGGSRSSPTVTWKDHGRGLLFHGLPCPGGSCGVDDTNVQVTITLVDSDELSAARNGKAPRSSNEIVAKEAEQHPTIDAVVSPPVSLGQQPTSQKATYTNDDGRFLINGKVAKVNDIALGDGRDSCPSEIVQKTLAPSIGNVVFKDAQWQADVCEFGSANDRTRVLYNSDGRVVSINRLLGFENGSFDVKAFMENARETYGDDGYNDAKKYILAYGNSFEVRDYFKKLDTGAGLIIEVSYCSVNPCSVRNRDIEISIDHTDQDAYKRMKLDAREASKIEAKKNATEFKF